jgi:hypothetical protein
VLGAQLPYQRRVCAHWRVTPRRRHHGSRPHARTQGHGRSARLHEHSGGLDSAEEDLRGCARPSQPPTGRLTHPCCAALDFVASFRRREGWMNKRRPGNKLIGKAYKTRYVVLDGDKLYWCVSRPASAIAHRSPCRYEQPPSSAPAGKKVEVRCGRVRCTVPGRAENASGQPLGAMELKDFMPVEVDEKELTAGANIEFKILPKTKKIRFVAPGAAAAERRCHRPCVVQRGHDPDHRAAAAGLPRAGVRLRGRAVAHQVQEEHRARSARCAPPARLPACPPARRGADARGARAQRAAAARSGSRTSTSASPCAATSRSSSSRCVGHAHERARARARSAGRPSHCGASQNSSKGCRELVEFVCDSTIEELRVENKVQTALWCPAPRPPLR